MMINRKYIVLLLLSAALTFGCAGIEGTARQFLPHMPAFRASAQTAPTPTPKAASSVSNVVAEQIQSASDQIDDAWAGLDTLPAGSPFSATITDTQLEASINEGLQQSGHQNDLKDIDVTIFNNGISISGTAVLPPFNIEVPAKVEVALALTPQGTLLATMTSATFGGVEAPQQIRSEIESALQQALTQADNRVVLTQFSTEGGVLTLAGNTQ